MADKTLCSIPDCGKHSRYRGWCGKHYQRWQKHGDPLKTVKVGRKPFAEATDGKKPCSKCGQVKLLIEYPEVKTAADGRLAECRVCLRVRCRQRYSKIPFEVRQEKHRRVYQRHGRSSKAKLESNVSCRIYRLLKGRGGSKFGARTREILGYTITELACHLERQFKPGMSWSNYNQHGWHIDHIVPLEEFKYTSFEDVEFKRAWALSNLRPLWGTENWSKGAKRLHLL